MRRARLGIEKPPSSSSLIYTVSPSTYHLIPTKFPIFLSRSPGSASASAFLFTYPYMHIEPPRLNLRNRRRPRHMQSLLRHTPTKQLRSLEILFTIIKPQFFTSLNIPPSPKQQHISFPQKARPKTCPSAISPIPLPPLTNIANKLTKHPNSDNKNY
jgi:hypothetical protein